MLSPEQIKARAGKLTASRVAVLMRDDRDAINQLWLEMIGDAVPEDLSDVWPVQLGSATEQLNLDWFERTNGVRVERRGDVVVHPLTHWAAATLDGFVDDDDGGYIVEAKHCGGREPIEVLVQRYFPQVSWGMFCTGTKQAALSIILGANAPVVEYVDRDEDYISGEDGLIARGKQFMAHVINRTPPVILPAHPGPVNATRVIDMQGDNRWASAAVEFLANKPARDICDDASKVLKSMVPADAKKAHGYGVVITRNRAGHLSLREVREQT